jgi:hypothetical protein
MASDYIEGALPPATREAMSRHAAGCADCRRDEAALTALTRELNVLPTVDPPLFFRENVMAAIERQGDATPTPGSAGWWRQLILGSQTAPGSGRVARLAMGTALAGGLAAAVIWGVFFPGGGSKVRTGEALPIVENLSGVLPGGSTASPTGHEPMLRVTRVTTMMPNSGPAYDLSFWLSNADKGVARWQFVGDPRSYTFTLNGNAPQTVRIPYTAAQGKDTIAVYVHWTADAVSHSRYLLLPVAADNTTTAPASMTATPPAARQSFGLPEESIVDAARDIAGHYRIPVTLDDVANGDQPIRLTAESETAAETLQRNLHAAGLEVTQTTAGIRIAPAAAVVPSPAPAVAPTP